MRNKILIFLVSSIYGDLFDSYLQMTCPLVRSVELTSIVRFRISETIRFVINANDIVKPTTLIAHYHAVIRIA